MACFSAWVLFHCSLQNILKIFRFVVDSAGEFSAGDLLRDLTKSLAIRLDGSFILDIVAGKVFEASALLVEEFFHFLGRDNGVFLFSHHMKCLRISASLHEALGTRLAKSVVFGDTLLVRVFFRSHAVQEGDHRTVNVVSRHTRVGRTTRRLKG